MTGPTFSHGDSDYLTDAQIAQLLKAIRPERVGKDAKGMSHVEAYEIRAHLNRIFGFGRWDEVISDQRVIFEHGFEDGKTDKYDQPTMRWTACWYAHCTLTLRSPSGQILATYGEGATGDATNLPSRADAHDMAAKTAASQALKRCAMNLGDQFGLSLYNKGSMRPLVKGLIWPVPETEAGEVDAHLSSPLAPERAEQNGESRREASSLPASKAPTGVQAPSAAGGGEPVLDEPATAVEDVPADEWTAEQEAALVAQAEAEQAAGPTVPDAATPSPAASEEPASVPAEAPDPTAASAAGEPAASAPEPETASDAGAADEDPEAVWEEIVGGVAVIRMSSPEEGLQLLHQWLELSVLHRFQARRFPDSEKSMGTTLTELMRDARVAIERRKAAVTQ